MHLERLSPNASQLIFTLGSEEDNDDDQLDDETKQNIHILGQWDDSFDEYVESDDESLELSHVDAPWREATARVIVEKEEDILDGSVLTSCLDFSHGPNPASSSRPIKRVDEYFCKSCGRGVRRTSRYIYEED